MFDQELQAEVKRVEVLVPKVDGPVAKACRITFRRELDVEVARALAGNFGVQALKQLHSRGITKVEFPIDAITAEANLEGEGGKRLRIALVSGMKAIGKVKKLGEKKEPDAPQVELKFQFAWSQEAWTFLGQNACAVVNLRLTRAQLSLAIGDEDEDAEELPEEKPKAKKSRARKESARVSRATTPGVHAGLEGSA